MIHAATILPGVFEANNHWYPKAVNAAIHPMVNFFLNLSKERIISRYKHLHPQIDAAVLSELMSYETFWFHWAGTDLINATSASGRRLMVVIENNSCPSGQKSMPLTDDNQEQGNYRWLIEKTFKPFVEKNAKGVQGHLAVIFDKNPMENSGYAAVIADVFNEPVYYAPWYKDDNNAPYRNNGGQLEVCIAEGEWKPLRAVFKYLTQKPWNRLPLTSRTSIFNPIIACIAGGRNKLLAEKAYDTFNENYRSSGLYILTPETFIDVKKSDIPKIIEKLGGHAVIKVPYSNAGQGVFTVLTKKELNDFMAMGFDYDCFVIQSLIGNYSWNTKSDANKFFHVGMIPTRSGETYVADLRMMVSSTQNGIKPLCIYARRAARPLTQTIDENADSWSMLGTNLSIKKSTNSWDTDTTRLILMDRRDFNRLGIGLDDLIEAYIQSLMSVIAIDQMAARMMAGGSFRHDVFDTLNKDEPFKDEILLGNKVSLI